MSTPYTPLCFAALAIVFSPLTANLIVSCVLGAILHVTAGATTLQAGMVAVGLLAVLQSVTSQRYTGAGFALMPTLLLFVTGLLSVTLAIATPTRNIFALSALVVAILIVFAKLAHGSRPVFAGYDHHNARATVVSVSASRHCVKLACLFWGVGLCELILLALCVLWIIRLRPLSLSCVPLWQAPAPIPWLLCVSQACSM